ncbi:MAG TPA: hypothetical protein VFE32_04665 [Puia sp.]|nr:hypothetical protein [Puia sp.]
MLNQFATATQSDSTDFLYNGLRMYFAAGDQNNGNPAGLPSEQVGKLTVIFVPTVANSASATKGGGQDDPYQYWWLFNGTPYNFPQMSSAPTDNDTAYRWISNYRTNKANATNGLTAYGRAPGHSGKPQFQETNSLWYNRTSIFGGPVGDQADCGIMGYIQTRIASITSMTISFGAYGHKEIPPFTQYYYQLLAQFDIKTADETLYFGSSTGAKFFEKKHMKPLTDGTTDTGLPCPPADPCNGSL